MSDQEEIAMTTIRDIEGNTLMTVRGADLTTADLTGADLTGADLDGANK